MTYKWVSDCLKPELIVLMMQFKVPLFFLMRRISWLVTPLP